MEFETALRLLTQQLRLEYRRLGPRTYEVLTNPPQVYKASKQHKPTKVAQLFRAIRARELRTVEEMLKAEPVLANSSEKSQTPLYSAVAIGSSAQVAMLLRYGAQDQPEVTKDSPVFLAASKGHGKCLALLLEGGQRPRKSESDIVFRIPNQRLFLRFLPYFDLAKARSYHENTPLHPRAHFNFRETRSLSFYRRLLEQGADLDARNEFGRTPLHQAVMSKQIALARFLVQAGAAPDLKSNTGHRPLHLATNEPDLVKLLLEHGASVRSSSHTGETPLHRAAAWGSTESIRLLLNSGAEPNEQTSIGASPTLLASLKGEDEAKALLLRSGGVLLPQGCEQKTNSKGRTLLCDVVGKNHTSLVERLLARGADPNADPEKEKTPLQEAAYRNAPREVEMLLEAGADPDFGASSPMAWAAAGGGVPCGRTLLRAGAAVNTRDQQGWTPLHAAAYRGRLDFVKWLVENGADVRVKNNDGKKAVEIAGGYWTKETKKHKAEIVEYLTGLKD